MLENKGSKSKNKKDRRELILNAAVTVFAQKGYGSMRIEDVAKEAGLSYGLAYYYYSSKEKLFYEVIKTAMETSIGFYRSVVNAEGTAYDKLRSLAANILGIYDVEEGLNVALLMVQAFSHLSIPEETRKLVDEKIAEYEGPLITLIEEAQAEGYAKGKDPRIVATMFNAMMEGYAVTRISFPKAPFPDADMLVSTLLS